ncbi:hypothetical protein CEXT_599871 [Caerostris extrusa]|uniref:Uncharacterized protein n=1 Tax=Caerostris extrusa TaxID=172846 RepID=A0AAV4Y832_CAEEX|nr:hypothetical protein CEXT_599871 [Caerostris extrusa]
MHQAPLWCGQTYNDTAARPPHTTLLMEHDPPSPYQSSGLSLFTLERLDNLGLHGEKWWTMAFSMLIGGEGSKELSRTLVNVFWVFEP